MPPATTPADGRTILVVGDSLSAGYGLALEEGWTRLLQARLAERHPGWAVVNASISGDTTRGGRARLPAALERHRASVVVIELGGNDGLRGVAVAETRANLRAMIEAARGAGARVLLLGMRLPPNLGPRYGELFEGVFRELADELGVALVPFFLEGVGGVRELTQEDGLHPRAEAQPILLDNVWPYLEALL
jgi:acyl-CoA thioesterase-1